MNSNEHSPPRAVALPPSLEDSALIDVKAVCAATGFASPTSIYIRLGSKPGDFPEPVRLSKRCTRWRVRDVRAWLEAQQGVAA